jgi:hypothetical protein
MRHQLRRDLQIFFSRMFASQLFSPCHVPCGSRAPVRLAYCTVGDVVLIGAVADRVTALDFIGRNARTCSSTMYFRTRVFWVIDMGLWASWLDRGDPQRRVDIVTVLSDRVMG